MKWFFYFTIVFIFIIIFFLLFLCESIKIFESFKYMLFIILINVFNKFYKGSLKKNIKYFLNLHYMNKNIFLMFF